MFKIKCDQCNRGALSLDRLRTIDDFKKNMRYEVIYEGTLINKDIPIYMYYICNCCNASVKLTPIEFEQKLREFMAETALRIKRADVMEQVDFSKVDPDNGLEYCGVCIGYDEKGSCLVDIIKQCPLIREKIKNEKLSKERS